MVTYFKMMIMQRKESFTLDLCYLPHLGFLSPEQINTRPHRKI